MTVKIAQTEEVKKFINIVSGTTSDKGNPRTKKIVHRILTDLFNTIEEFDVQPQEFWAAIETEARKDGLSLAALVARVDAGREGQNLASALRVHVLNRLGAPRQDNPSAMR